MSGQAQPTFRELSDELDAVLAQLQADDMDVDEALKLYEQGTKLVQQLEKRLATAENTITELKAKEL
jgi:exodeoxyribonuclease VII small subunit